MTGAELDRPRIVVRAWFTLSRQFPAKSPPQLGCNGLFKIRSALDQASAATALLRRENLRDAVFL